MQFLNACLNTTVIAGGLFSHNKAGVIFADGQNTAQLPFWSVVDFLYKLKAHNKYTTKAQQIEPMEFEPGVKIEYNSKTVRPEVNTYNVNQNIKYKTTECPVGLIKIKTFVV